jgi:hypothetical protein
MAAPNPSVCIHILSNVPKLAAQLAAKMPHLKFIDIPNVIDGKFLLPLDSA